MLHISLYYTVILPDYLLGLIVKDTVSEIAVLDVQVWDEVGSDKSAVVGGGGDFD